MPSRREGTSSFLLNAEQERNEALNEKAGRDFLLDAEQERNEALNENAGRNFLLDAEQERGEALTEKRWKQLPGPEPAGGACQRSANCRNDEGSGIRTTAGRV